jgi:hypothetical protein
MSDNEPGGIENATHNTLERKPGPEMLERVHGNIVKRANVCLDANGENFEHLFFLNL